MSVTREKFVDDLGVLLLPALGEGIFVHQA
jgi:hypothetical protein